MGHEQRGQGAITDPPVELESPRERGLSANQRFKLLTAAITVGGAMFAAIVGMLGPVTTWLGQKHQLEVEAAKTEHEQRIAQLAQRHAREMDFLEKLVVADAFDSEIARSYYRRDVLKFFATTLDADNPLRAFADSELDQTQKRVAVIEALQKEKEEAIEKAAQAVAELEKLKAEVNGQGASEPSETKQKEAEARVAIARVSVASTKLDAYSSPKPAVEVSEQAMQQAPPAPSPSPSMKGTAIKCGCPAGDLMCAMKCAAR